MPVVGAIFPSDPRCSRWSSPSLPRIQAMEGKTSAALEDLGVRRVKASLWLRHATLGESSFVPVLGRPFRDHSDIPTKPMLLLSAKPGYRCQYDLDHLMNILLTCFRFIDNVRHPDPLPHSSYHQPPCAIHPTCEPSRIYRIWQLWEPAQRHVVV